MPGWFGDEIRSPEPLIEGAHVVEEGHPSTSDARRERQERVAQGVRTLNAAAIAGVVYGILSFAGVWMLSEFPSLSSSDEDLTAWFDDGGNQARLITGLNLASLSAVMFLWFVAVIRRRLGDREDRFFATVFFGSAITYVAVWLCGGVAFAAPAVAMTLLDASSVSPATASLSGGAGAAFLLVVAPRIQAVFVFSTSSVLLRSGRFPRWLAFVGYAFGVVLFVVPLVTRPMGLAFPVWVIVVSITIFFHRSGPPIEAGESVGVGGDETR